MATTRERIASLLAQAEYSARDISQALHISEKEVYDHLSHIAKSVSTRKMRLIIVPSSCRSCGYVFEDRGRFKKPGRCPRCKGERIDEPRYKVE